MKNLLIISFLLLSGLNGFGQNNKEVEWKNISFTDSTKIDTYWNSFINAIEKNDSSKIKSVSLDKISCDLCKANDNSNNLSQEDYMISIDYYIANNIKDFNQSQLWKALNKRGYTTLVHVIDNLNIYEIWIPTYLPNEWADGHEGQSHAFQFIKQENEFKFYGITSIP